MTSIFPEKYRVISGSMLKTIALVAMLLDHTSKHLLKYIDFFSNPRVSVFGKDITICFIMSLIGRLAFPIYCFLLTEGYLHTRDKKRYGINLLAFALISEIPWNLEHCGELLYSRKNVFFTMFMGYLAICAAEKYRGDTKKLILTLLVIFFGAILMKADYGVVGVGFIMILYLLRERKVLQAVVGSSVLGTPYGVICAFVPINMYNGERGFIKGNAAKYAYYAAYPLHLLLIWYLRIRYFGFS